MKTIKTLVLLVLVFVSNYAISQQVTYGGRMKLGLNVGGIVQQADIRSRTGLGYGATLEWAFLENDHSFFGLSLRGRYLGGTAHGIDVTLNDETLYPTSDNDAINGSIGSPNSLDYTGRSYYANNRTRLNEWSGEGMIKFNRLRANTGILLYGFGGLGFTNYRARMDHIGPFGQQADYTNIEGISPWHVRVDLNAQRDGTYESFAETESGIYGRKTTVLTPTLGYGIGVMMSPMASIAFEHKISFPQTDYFDGHVMRSQTVTGKNDIYHYLGLKLAFSLWGRANGYYSGSSSSHHSSGSSMTLTPIIILRKPDIRNFSAPDCQTKVVATIDHIDGVHNITFAKNGIMINRSRYTYDRFTKEFSVNVQLNPGPNTFKIVAINNGKRDEKEFVLTCGQPDVITGKLIRICHNGQTLMVDEAAWPMHKAHGDTQGDCPTIVNPQRMTICHNGQTLTIDQEAWPTHQGHGDRLGKCPQVTNEKKITICHNNTTMTINESVWSSYQSQGATRGACPIINNPRQIRICYQGKNLTINESDWLSYQRLGAMKGDCPIIVKKITICHNGQTIQIDENAWLIHKGHGDVMGTCPLVPPSKIKICHKGNTLMIDANSWPAHQAHGDYKGACIVLPPTMITICHDGQTVQIDEDAWPVHQGTRRL